MLTVTKTKEGNGFSVFSKKKQKVRLASGLDENNHLNQQTIDNGLACLQSFRHELDKLQPCKVIITATAALRLANNKALFIQQAEKILHYPINLISGIEEAKTIYRGVAFTEQLQQQLLVLDIGGASTELVLGEGSTIHVANSLDIGCVTWLNHYFADNLLNEYNFQNAINAARQIISSVKPQYMNYQWQLTLGASGTIQAVNEVNQAQALSTHLSAQLLEQIKQQCIQCQSIKTLEISGLKDSRKPVFASGLAILIALFESLNIDAMRLSKGALREGLISILFEE